MLQQWIVFFVCLWLPLAEMFSPVPQPDMMQGGADKMKHDAMEMKDKAVEAKKELDEEELTEQQFYECFADVNCDLGDAVREELFDCWRINTPEELDEYSKLFGDSPVGNFTKLTPTGVNEDFCVLDDYDQRKVNDHFAAKASETIKEICGSPKVRDKCKRLKETAQCVMQLLEKYIANGQCETIVAEMEGMEPMKEMGGK
ncbi:uncharacterized protein LOC129957518 [Argiope bruennichi]|uniref:uncharacterized protein LOC129957518 n=1 Tax=Argiope bruennichi TaxID=94029 RepID=UPI00249482DF|nr:uncharacterized protein LOC129957518 [Argiope bruennichi]